MKEAIKRIRALAIEILLEAYGFRRNRNRWACIFHDDRRPSCTVRNNRLHCWVCNRWWSSIDLVMELDGLDLKGAVRLLADFYGIPIQDRPLSREERCRHAQVTAATEALAVRLADFAHGLNLVLERHLGQLSAVLLAREMNPAKTLAHYHRQLHLLRAAQPKDIAELWRTMPAESTMLERVGREDRQQAEAITAAVVDVIGAAQRNQEAA